jgi:acyl-CoA dehydrogenase
MDFSLTTEQELIRETMRSFVTTACPRETMREFDVEQRFPRELWAKLAGTGMLGAALPEEHGGTPTGVVEQLLVTEELARGALPLAVAFVNTACLGASVLAHLASPALLERLAPRLVAGEVILSFAWTEPDAGSDVLAMRSTATPAEDDGYVVNGTKTFITLAAEADHIFAVVRTASDGGSRAEGFTCLLLDGSDHGVEVRKLGKVGQRSAPFAEVHLGDVHVPPERRVGAEGRALQEIGHVLAFERILFSAVCVGLARQALDDAARYALERTAFGKPIGGFQAIQHHLADVATMIESANLLTHRAAWLHARGDDVRVAGTQAFLAASSAAGEATDRGMQILGAAGYSTEFDMERYWRDARAFRVSPITTEVAKGVVARGLGMPRSY